MVKYLPWLPPLGLLFCVTSLLSLLCSSFHPDDRHEGAHGREEGGFVPAILAASAATDPFVYREGGSIKAETIGDVTTINTNQNLREGITDKHLASTLAQTAEDVIPDHSQGSVAGSSDGKGAGVVPPKLYGDGDNEGQLTSRISLKGHQIHLQDNLFGHGSDLSEAQTPSSSLRENVFGPERSLATIEVSESTNDSQSGPSPTPEIARRSVPPVARRYLQGPNNNPASSNARQNADDDDGVGSQLAADLQAGPPFPATCPTAQQRCNTHGNTCQDVPDPVEDYVACGSWCV